MTFEDKLRDAFERAAAGLPAAPRPGWEETYVKAKRSRMRQRVVFALAAVLLAAGGWAGAAWFTRGDEGGRRVPVAGGSEPTPSPASTPLPDCSAAGLDAALPPQPGLPAAVDATRRAIAELAVRCDYRGLAALVPKGGQEFSFSFGLAARGPAAYWEMLEESGEPVLFDLVQILKASYATGEEVYGTNEGPKVYWWPRAFRAGATEKDFQELIDLGVIDDKELELYRDFGSYIGYRLSILANGDWTAFIAGD